ncbi:MAG: hypothetical protein ABI461_08260 [Polyangiaceae bacterium]
MIARRAWSFLILFAIGTALGSWSISASAQADPAPDTLAHDAIEALRAGHPADAIANFEALADRGTVDANMSFDRGLAYAQRVRVGGEQPGDLGLAAHGFEEARSLSRDSALRDQATHALTIIRAEVGRRRARAGSPIDLEQTPLLRDALVGVVSEDTWSGIALFASVVAGAALFLRWLTQARRVEVAANVAFAIAVPVLFGSAVCTVAARNARLHRIEGVVISATARPSDARGIALPSAEPLPEGARVRVLSANAGWDQIRWGATDMWIPSTAVRPLEKPASE